MDITQTRPVLKKPKFLSLSKLSASPQTHKHNQIKPIQKKKKSLEQPRSIVMRKNTIRERECNQRERRQSILKIVKENKIKAFYDVPEQSEKVIRVSHGRPNST